MVDESGEPLVTLSPGCVVVAAAWCLMACAQEHGIMIRMTTDGELDVQSPRRLHPDTMAAIETMSTDMTHILVHEAAASIH
jgi:hypothetical protein